MPKALVKIDGMQSGGAASLLQLTYTYATDTGIVDQSNVTIDLAQSNATNAATIRSATVDAIKAFEGGAGPVLQPGDVTLLDYPS